MCTQYNQLSITEQSVETCSQLVAHNEGCISGHGHFFYGEVNPNHRECSCCMGTSEVLTDNVKANTSFNIYKLKHEHGEEKEDELGDSGKKD